MPTPEEIKKLCTEYVDELFAFDDMSEQENIEAKNDAFVMCMAFAGHILEKHCIVPKSVIIEKWNEVKTWRFSEYFRGCFQVLKELFGTELFNEEK